MKNNLGFAAIIFEFIGVAVVYWGVLIFLWNHKSKTLNHIATGILILTIIIIILGWGMSLQRAVDG